MALYLVEHITEDGVRSRCICETPKGAQVMAKVWRHESDRRAMITMLTGYYRVASSENIEFIPMCKEIVQEIRFEVEKL